MLVTTIVTSILCICGVKALETDKDVETEKYNVQYQNLTEEEKHFLNEIVNYNSEINLKYLILNKTQEMYEKLCEDMYKQAEQMLRYNDDHLDIKYYYQFCIHQQFEVVYYPKVEKFFFKLLRYIPREVKNAMRYVFYPEMGHDKEEFVENERMIDTRINIIRNIIEDALKCHYVYADQMFSYKFFNHTKLTVDALWRTGAHESLIKEYSFTTRRVTSSRNQTRQHLYRTVM